MACTVEQSRPKEEVSGGSRYGNPAPGGQRAMLLLRGASRGQDGVQQPRAHEGPVPGLTARLHHHPDSEQQ